MRPERLVTKQDQAYNSYCPACVAQRLHTETEWKDFHPFRGHGYTKEHGWTHPDLAKSAEGAA